MPEVLTNIAIADDHTLFRKALKGFLTQRNNLQVTIEVSTAIELLEQLKSKPVDILVTDISMPELSGFEAVKIIKSLYPRIKVIVLSMYSDLEMVNDLIDIGIHAYISKADEPEHLLQALNAVIENRVYKNKIFTDALYWHRQFGTKVSKPNITLEEREKKILQLLWEEKSNKEIADEVFLGVRSIEKIRQAMKEKLGVKSTIGLLKYGLNKKIIGIDKSANAFQGCEA
jgi:DNA-binding NarL/FixJ family response regulator